MRNAPVSFLNELQYVMCGNVRKFVKLSILSIIFGHVFKIFGSKLYRQIVDIPVSTNCCRFAFVLLPERPHVDCFL